MRETNVDEPENDGQASKRMASAGVSQAYVLFGICFILVLCIGGVLQGLSFKLGLAATLIFFLLLPALLFIRSKGIGIFEGLRFRAVRPSVLCASFFLGFGTWAVGISVARGLSALGLKSLGQGLDAGLDTPFGFAMSLLVVAVGPGICEESLFRGAIQGVFERRGKWFAVIVTSILFGLLHMMLGVVIPATILGCFYGWVVIRTGSIVPAMVAHFANNTAALLYLYVFQGDDPSWLVLGLLVVGAVAVATIVRKTQTDQSTLAHSPLSHVPAGLPLWATLGFVVPLLAFVVLAVGLTSTIPYLIQGHTLDGGEQVFYADQDSPLFEIFAKKSNVRVLYGEGEEWAVGRMVEITDEGARIKDRNDESVEIPMAEIRGVVVNP